MNTIFLVLNSSFFVSPIKKNGIFLVSLGWLKKLGSKRICYPSHKSGLDYVTLPSWTLDVPKKFLCSLILLFVSDDLIFSVTLKYRMMHFTKSFVFINSGFKFLPFIFTVSFIWLDLGSFLPCLHCTFNFLHPFSPFVSYDLYCNIQEGWSRTFFFCILLILAFWIAKCYIGSSIWGVFDFEV